MLLGQLFINKEQNKFMLIKMPNEVTPDKYQNWASEKERENNIQIHRSHLAYLQLIDT